jgi:hypothetical protein
VPVQSSATSHTPADDRHTVPPAMNRSVGQLAESPVHVSATSQAPLAARHTVPEAAS